MARELRFRNMGKSVYDEVQDVKAFQTQLITITGGSHEAHTDNLTQM